MKMKRKTIVATLIAILVVMALVVVLVATTETTSDDVIKIGYIGPLTGDVAVLGMDASNAIKVAVEEVNTKGGIDGKQVELFIEDDQYSTSQTIAAYDKLVHVHGVETIIVSTYGGLFAIADKAEVDGVMVVDSLDCDDDIAALQSGIFCVAKETRDLAEVIADFAIEQEFETVGVVHGTVDPFMPSVAQMFDARVAPKGIETKIESYVPGTTDFKTQLAKVEDTDALVFLGYDEIGIAIKQAEELGIDKPSMTIASVATTPSIVSASQGAIDGMYFSFYAPLDGNLEAKRFYSAYAKMHGREPYVFVASDHAYDSAKILLEEVLPEVDGETKGERLEQKKELMYSVKDFEGVSGTLSIDQDGRVSGIKIRLYQLKDLKPEYISG